MWNDGFAAAAWPAIGSAAPPGSVTPDDDPVAIYDGAAVAECAWPSVVALYEIPQNGPDERCAGVYVGGRVILTAAHCTGSTYRVPSLCLVDEDCPDLGEYDADVGGLVCDKGGVSCSSPKQLISNEVRYARFGEDYEGATEDGHPRKSIAIAYCKPWSADPGIGSPSDFAYCILTEEPDVQPVPILMDCEVDAHMDNEPELYAVGFGQFDENIQPGGLAGVKRWAKTDPIPTTYGPTSAHQVWSVPTIVDWTTAGGAPSDGPAPGDSGGPLFVQLPDSTWRVVGVALTSAETYAMAWPKVAEMLADPNISEADLIPCHDTSGNWMGGSECTESPREPDQPAGSWTRGAAGACSGQQTQRTNTCPPQTAAPASAPGQLAPTAGQPTATSPRAPGDLELVGGGTASCRVNAGGSAPGTLAGLALLLLTCGVRRQRGTPQ